MAKKQQANNQSTSSVKTNTFNKGMVKDIDPFFAQDGTWFHAVNAINNSNEGNLGTIGNEPANYLCTVVPNTIIGVINLSGPRWVVFSAGNGNSEIGEFNEELCEYTTIVSDPCLNFSPLHLIKGVSKENFDCTWQIYWSDGSNPDRTMTVENPPFIENCLTDPFGCVVCSPTTLLDCEKIRLAKIIRTPCFTVQKGKSGGSLLNGSYMVAVAYVLNSQRVGDYFVSATVQPIFDHANTSGSLDVIISDMDAHIYNEFELVVIRTINQQVSAKKIGVYSTRINSINIDYINEDLPTVPIEQIPLRTPNYEKSDAIYETGNYMIRVGPTSRFDFNYQVLANQISTKWIAAKYPIDYYKQGGNVTGYLRDEQYAFWIRWVYNTGEKSSSYHIPGRPPFASDLINAPVSQDNLEVLYDGLLTAPFWQVYNTATFAPASGTLPDGGIIIAEGQMGYWESSEKYPDTKPEIWNASFYPWSDPGVSDFDLCGKNIRHHKMPDNNTINHFTTNTIVGPNGPYEVVDGMVTLGVEFDNIRFPRDNNGIPVPGIIGYEILRGSREGNKTVVAKGMINNMRKYEIYDEGNNEPGNSKIGLFQNYPYNPTFTPGSSLTPWDPTLSASCPANGSIAPEGVLGNMDPTKGCPPSYNFPPSLFNLDITDPGGGISQRYLTFHSPDTQFRNPFLGIKELKIYGEISGRVKGNFSEVPGHPKHKLLSDASFVLAAIAGFAAAALAMRGQKTTVRKGVQSNNIGQAPMAGVVTAAQAPSDFGSSATSSTAAQTVANNLTEQTTQSLWLNTILDVVSPFGDLYDNVLIPLGSYMSGFNPGTQAYGEERIIDNSPYMYTDFGLRIISGFAMLTYYFSVGTDAALALIKSLVTEKQYTLRYLSHGDYTNYTQGNASPGNQRRRILESIYMDNQLQEFSNGKTINNLYRGRAVAVEIGSLIPFTSTGDNTIQSLETAFINGTFGGGDVTISAGWFSPLEPYSKPSLPFNTTACSYYGALKIKIDNQYGQMDSIRQIPTSGCITLVYDEENPALPPNVPPTTAPYLEPFTSPILFGGDTYIGRYTEKNTFFYFYDWLYDQPNGFEFDYRLKYMVNYPRYWADFTLFETSDFVTSFLSNPANPAAWSLPSSKHHLEKYWAGGSPASWVTSSFINMVFSLPNSYFYLFNSGVRDFVVESEINVDLRDWGDASEERHYDPYRYTDLRQLFDTTIIKAGNFYKYDFSLSIGRLYNNFISWGNMQERDYDPVIAETCYTYQPNRILYSLPQNLESKRDYWQLFLVNNYKDFKSRVTAIKPINKTGALIMFDNESPVMFQGVDILETDLGTKVNIGDGGLFNQALQNIVNSDKSYEYGSCQDRLSVINTPSGVYWMSQNQGKIFNYGDGLSEISSRGMKWWFSNYLPYALLEDFPDYEFVDNPVAGIGCQSIYDNDWQLLYFCKKDYKLRTDLPPGTTVTYPGSGNSFLVNGALRVDVGDPAYFRDASWTISYDPKTQAWISFHDWHPDLLIPSKNSFLSINKFFQTPDIVGGIWRHNSRVDLYCNYYGQDRPFIIDLPQATGQEVNTLRSIEYLMEALRFAPNETDWFHVLDYNFDHAIVYNSEQVSGMLIMHTPPKNDPFGRIQYPTFNATSIDILCSKEEQKYRFNQFWDITDNRGEFTTMQRTIWLTSPDGYTRVLNPVNLDYAKAAVERKKFRHYINNVLLYRNISGNTKILLHLINNKNLYSPR